MNIVEAIQAIKKDKKRVRRKIDGIEIRYTAGRVKMDYAYTEHSGHCGTLPMIQAWLEAEYEIIEEK